MTLKNDPVYSEKEKAFSLYSNVNVLFVFKPRYLAPEYYIRKKEKNFQTPSKNVLVPVVVTSPT
jgi:hypothetical protein